MTSILLKQIAYARSGDKGNSANIGLIAFTTHGYNFLQQQITEERVLQYFSEMPVKKVTRYELPNLGAFNFLLDGILGKGGSQSLAIDAQGKALGQALLAMEIDVNEQLLPDLLPSDREAPEGKPPFLNST